MTGQALFTSVSNILPYSCWRHLWQCGLYLKVERPGLFRWRAVSFRDEIRLGKSQFECALTSLNGWILGGQEWIPVLMIWELKDGELSVVWTISTFNVLVGGEINKNKKRGCFRDSFKTWVCFATSEFSDLSSHAQLNLVPYPGPVVFLKKRRPEWSCWWFSWPFPHAAPLNPPLFPNYGSGSRSSEVKNVARITAVATSSQTQVFQILTSFIASYQSVNKRSRGRVYFRFHNRHCYSNVLTAQPGLNSIFLRESTVNGCAR